jgi:hypothetical protein
MNSNPLISVKVYLEDKRSYTTSVNKLVYDEEIRQYFVGKSFELEEGKLTKCVGVEITRSFGVTP